MYIDGYYCVDEGCPKKWCWAPGRYEHRATTGRGSRNTNRFSLTCMYNAYHGCPSPLPLPGEDDK